MKRRKFIRTSLLAYPLLSGASKAKAMPYETNVQEKSEVINTGVGGNNTVDLLARIEKDCLTYTPELTVLMIGTNDMNSRKYIPLADYEKNMQTIIDKILKTGSKILLMNLLPVYEPYLMTRHKPEFYAPEGHSGRLSQMNTLIKKLATEYKLSFLDLHHVFAKVGNIGLEVSSLIKNEANSHNKDGLHPTLEGYRLIGTLVYQQIMQQNLPHEKIVCFGDSITIGDGKPDGANYPAYLQKLLNS